MSKLKDNYLNEDQQKLVSAFTEVLKRENKPIKEDLSKVKKDIEEIKDNHLKHIEVYTSQLCKKITFLISSQRTEVQSLKNKLS